MKQYHDLLHHILDNGAKITGTINLVVGNTSMQFFDGKITATINDASGGTCYFTNVDVAGSTLNFSNGGYKFISNSTSAPAVINLTGTGGTLELRDITGGIVPLNIGAGWTVVHYNCTVAILSNAGTIIDGLHIPIAGLIANQTALNVILAQTSSIYFGFYIVNFDNPVITGMTIAKGDVFYKVSATGNAKVYTFGNAPASFSLIVSATQRSTIIKDIDKWVNSKIETDAGLALKQNITDNTLTTTSKTVPGAINELKASVDGAVISNETVSTDNDFVVFSSTTSPLYNTVTANRDFSNIWNGWGRQLDNNFGQNFGFQLSIPIFNGNQSKAAYQQSKLNYQSASLQQENAQRKLKQDIYAAYTNAVVAYNKLNANQKAVTTAEKAYSFATKRYELGLLGTVELLNNQNNFLKAKVNYKAAQYEYVFRIKLLEFYKGEALSL